MLTNRGPKTPNVVILWGVSVAQLFYSAPQRHATRNRYTYDTQYSDSPLLVDDYTKENWSDCCISLVYTLYCTGTRGKGYYCSCMPASDSISLTV